MRKQIQGLVALLSLFIMLAEIGQGKPNGPMKVDIPFDFMVGKTHLPAGQYTVARFHETGSLQISCLDKRASTLSNTYAVQENTRASQPRLVFHRYGNRYFLGQVWYRFSVVGQQIPKSRIERELERHSKELAGKTVELVTVPAQ